MQHTVHIRPLTTNDSLQELTALLHRAYARLGEMGLNYTAVDQAVEVTARRAAEGHCLIAELNGKVAGTITVSGPYDKRQTAWAMQTDWFYRADTAHFHQFAVEPKFQGHGIGDALVHAVEQWAREQGYAFMALDTAMPAMHLRRRYARLGYRDVGEVQWGGKVYKSVIMAKQLDDSTS